MAEPRPYSGGDFFRELALAWFFSSLSIGLSMILAHRVAWGRWIAQDEVWRNVQAFSLLGAIATLICLPAFWMMMRKPIGAGKAALCGASLALAAGLVFVSLLPDLGPANSPSVNAPFLIALTPLGALSALIIQFIIGPGNRYGR